MKRRCSWAASFEHPGDDDLAQPVVARGLDLQPGKHPGGGLGSIQSVGWPIRPVVALD
jgi:hypothetical protein